MNKLGTSLTTFIVIAAFSAPLAAETHGAYALRDARIVPVSGPVIEHGTVILRDGLIEAVGESVAVPADAWVLDCKGLTVYPGLVDALSTWGLTNSPPEVAAGRGGRGGGAGNAAATPTTTPAAAAATTPARGPEDRPSNTSWLKAADEIFPNDRALETFRNGGFTTAVTFPRGNIFSGQGSVLDLAGDRSGDMVVAPSVGQLLTLTTPGRGGGGGGGRGYPGSLMGVIAYIRQIYMDADRYRTAQSIYEKHPQGLARPAYDRAVEGVLANTRILIPASRDVEIERMVAFTHEPEFTTLKVTPILYGGSEAWRATDVLKSANTPMLVSLKYPARVADSDPDQEEPLRVLEMRQKAPDSAGALAKAGVKFAFYSDGLNTPAEIDAAVRKAIEAGLDQPSAVRALTLSAAEIYGVADRLGSVEKGKIANLVVTEGDLFAQQSKIKYVFVDGTKFEPPAEPPARGGGRGRGGRTQ